MEKKRGNTGNRDFPAAHRLGQKGGDFMIPTVLLLLANSLFPTLRLQNTGSFPKPLTAAQEQEYLRRWAEGDLQARNVRIERNMRLVAHIIKKVYCKRLIPLD